MQHPKRQAQVRPVKLEFVDVVHEVQIGISPPTSVPIRNGELDGIDQVSGVVIVVQTVEQQSSDVEGQIT